jgi:hypothetical protein
VEIKLYLVGSSLVINFASMMQIKTGYELAVELAELKYQLEHGKPKRTKTKTTLPRSKPFKDLTLAERKIEGYTKRAMKKGIEISLTVEQVESLLNTPCIYCGDKADCLDRIDSKKGYTIENVQPSCNTCNMMKYTHATDEFINHIQKILDHYKR